MKIKGTVENIIFRNAENLYTVLELETEETPVIATGVFPALSEGESLELEGEFKESKYGLQFVATSYVSVGFENISAMRRYLAGGLFKGVGEVTARAITDKFGKRTFEIIENSPESLTRVKGISPKKALEIAKAYRDVIGMKEALIYLTERGLTFAMSLKIFNEYKEHTISTVKKNPYSLVYDVDGIGFRTADDIAIKMGIEKNSEFRVSASFLYILKEIQSKEGSTAIELAEIIRRGNILLETEDVSARYEKVLADFLIDGKVKKVELGGEIYVSNAQSYYLERNLSELLKGIEKNAAQIIVGKSADIEEFEKKEKITLHEKQKDAVLTAIGGGLTVITGGPGTGKTTIIKCIIHLFSKQGLSISLVAPTGRAAKRLSESTGEEAKTIHRLLDLDYKNGKGMFTFNENTKLETDVLIVDEVSMADVFVMKSLMSAVKFGARVILVGDKDQLPSVGAGNVLKDILESEIFSYVSLSEVYRQGKESLIVTNAHAINSGEMPILNENGSDFFYSSKSIPDDMLSRIVEMVTKTLPKFASVPAKEIQILSPMKKGLVGVNNLNRVMQSALNPNSGGANFIQLSETEKLFEGDKVMQTVNNYQIEWMKESGDSNIEFGSGVFNGDIGEVISIDKKSGEVRVFFEDGRNVDYDSSNASDLTLAYAISIHKSQGSEFDVIIIPITGGSPMLFTRNLLYTGITRGKKLVVLMGDRYNIKRMVDNNYIEKRTTLLKYFLIGEIR